MEGPSPFAPTLSSAIQLRPGDDLAGNAVRSNKRGITYRDRAAGLVEDNEVELNTLEGILVTGRAAPALLRNRVVENGGAGLAYQDKAAGTARRTDLRDNVGPAVLRPAGCRADLDAYTLGEQDALADAWQAVRAALGPDADPVVVAAALARLYAHAPRGDELEAWLAEGLG
jgi:hypothetical protein